MTADFTDLGQHGRRLNSVVKRLYKRFMKENDIDKQIKLANSIGFVTREVISISKLHLGIGELLEQKAIR